MKRTAALMFLSLSLSLTAQAHHANPFWYAGVAYSTLNAELKAAGVTGDSEPSAINFVVGHEFNKYFALEALLNKGIYDDRVSGSVANFAFELNYAIGASAVGILPISETFNVYGKLGAAKVEYEDDVRGSADATGAIYGVGATFDINKQFSVNAEYIQYPDGDYNSSSVFDDVETSAFNIGVSFKF